MNPFDTIKQRMQAESKPELQCELRGVSHVKLEGKPEYRTIFQCAKSVYQREGIRAFYASFPTSLLLNLPYQGIQFPVYEFCRATLNPTNEYSPMTHVLAGSIAGAIASAATTPLDVIKTLLQTKGLHQDPLMKNLTGMKETAKFIALKHGAKGFWRGLTPRVLTHTPATALCWTTYEYFKFILKETTKME